MRLAIDCRLIGETGIGTFIENVLNNIVLHTENEYVLIGNTNKLVKYQQLTCCKVVKCSLRSFTPAELLCFPVREVNACDAFYTPNFNLPLGIKVPIFSAIINKNFKASHLLLKNNANINYVANDCNIHIETSKLFCKKRNTKGKLLCLLIILLVKKITLP